MNERIEFAKKHKIGIGAWELGQGPESFMALF